ncbi:MAG: hypothetical protein K1X65_25150, partial [Caldilineales bacterium]|nr:hypothetical protein [Caldilineales bacterium]
MTQWTYDAADRVKTMTYPGGNNSQVGEVVTYTYNPQGLVETMVGTSTYVASTTYNALGQTTDRWLGSNGVVRQHYD